MEVDLAVVKGGVPGGGHIRKGLGDQKIFFSLSSGYCSWGFLLMSALLFSSLMLLGTMLAEAGSI